MSSPAPEFCKVPVPARQRHAVGIGRAPRPSDCPRGETGDEPGEHRGGFLAHQFSVVVLIEFVQFHQSTGQPWLTRICPGRSGGIGGRDFRASTRTVSMPPLPTSAPMLRLPDGCDTGGRPPASRAGRTRCRRVSGPFSAVPVHDGQMLGFQHLQFGRHRQPILGTAVAQCGSVPRRPSSMARQASCSPAKSVSPAASASHQSRHNAWMVRVAPIGHQPLRLDAGADGVGDEEPRAGGIGPGITPHQIAALGAQFRLRVGQCSDRTGLLGNRPNERATRHRRPSCSGLPPKTRV